MAPTGVQYDDGLDSKLQISRKGILPTTEIIELFFRFISFQNSGALFSRKLPMQNKKEYAIINEVKK